MTVRYPDISNHQPSFMSLKGEVAVCAKASQGTGFTDPDYPAFKASAATAGVFFFAYHFLDTSDPAAQAAHCHAITGQVPLMVDMEETTGSEPAMRDMAGFVDAYRKLGGVCWLLYLPQWYWQKIGRPPMDPVTRRGLLLVSSHYGDPYTDADSGAGWQPYGGVTPTVWQYTTTHPVNGVPVDYNAYRGSKAELASLVTTGKRQAVKSGKYTADGTMSLRQVTRTAGTGVPAVLFATAVAKHAQGDSNFGPMELDYLHGEDWDAKLIKGTVVWLP